MNNLIYASISIIKLILYINIFILYYILYIINIIYYIRNSERGCGNDRDSIKARDRDIDSYTPLLRGGYKSLNDIYDRYDIYDKYRYTRVVSNNNTPRVIDGVRSPPRQSCKYKNENNNIRNNNRNKGKRRNKNKTEDEDKDKDKRIVRIRVEVKMRVKGRVEERIIGLEDVNVMGRLVILEIIVEIRIKRIRVEVRILVKMRIMIKIKVR